MSKQTFDNISITLTGCVLTRSLSANDVELLSAAFAASQPWLTLCVTAKGLKNYLLSEDDSLYRYAVHVDNNLAGVICLRHPWLRGSYIELLGLIEAYRGRGIGTQLLKWAETEARHQGNNLWLVTSAFNQQAIQFYQRHGFKQVGIIEGLVHPDYNEILFRKRLD